MPYCLKYRATTTLMFINSLQLIAYLIMLDVAFPSNVLLFLMPYLDLVRLKIPESFINLSDSYLDKSSSEEKESEQDFLSIKLQEVDNSKL